MYMMRTDPIKAAQRGAGAKLTGEAAKKAAQKSSHKPHLRGARKKRKKDDTTPPKKGKGKGKGDGTKK